MMLAICKGESCSASHANIGVDPFRRLVGKVSTATGFGQDDLAQQRTALLSIMLLDTTVLGGNWKPSRCSVEYTSVM